MMNDITRWLSDLNLGKFTQLFTENDIDLIALPHITEEDLKELGVTLGARRKILAAIQVLQDGKLTAPVADPTNILVASSEVETAPAERRQLTVMFCDLVGSTALSRRLDPEDLRDIMRRYQDAVAGAVTRYGGHVAKYLGDGVLAYFGWPQAYEDQAERAVRAGMDAVAAVNDVHVGGERALEARVGIATGQVVVGDLVNEIGRDAEAVSGETPNLAARLQQVAAPGQIIVSETTHRLVGQTFAVDDLGGHDLKGFDEAVRAWRVTGEVITESRFEAAHGSALGRIVGRETELQLLLDRWVLAEGCEGQAVLVSGEAGIGKSRLMQGLHDQVAKLDHIHIHYQCSPYHGNSALYPTIRQLEQAAGFAPDSSGEEKLDKLEALLREAGDDAAVDAPLFANLLSLPFEARHGGLAETPQQIKERLLEALVTQLLRLSERRPVLFLFEDTHWIDPTSEELMGRIIDRLQNARILLIVTHRPEWQPGFSGHGHVTSLQLNRLGKAQGAEIVRSIAGDKISDDVVDRIVARTDGVPLFVEELTKTLVEGGLDVEDADIPATLQASLLARIDRLGQQAKWLAQIGAVIGREIPHDLLALVSGLSARDLDVALDGLIRSELIFQSGTPPLATYKFKHALVQDSAYETLLISRRRQLHEQVAKILKQPIPGIAEVEPEILAHHFTVAGKWDSAITYWQKAGRRASLQSANREAAAHYSHGLEVLSELPINANRNELELELQLALGPSLMALKGWSGAEVRSTYERAQALCEILADYPRRFTATWGLWMHYQASANHRQARNLTQQLLDYAEDTTSDFALQAQHATWTTLLYTGELTAARDHCVKGIALYDFDTHRDHAHSYAGHDPGVCGYNQGALIDWLLGYAEQAQEKLQLADTLAARLGHAGSSAHALNFSARQHSLFRNFELTQKNAEACVVLAKNIGAAMYIGSGNLLSGWASVQFGEADHGLALMQQGIAQLDEIGQFSARPHFLALLAEACMQMGQFEEAEMRLGQAVDQIERSGERFMEAEIYRLNGALKLAHGKADPSEAEAQFSQAMEISQAQGAKAFELRAARDLAALWHAQGRSDQAHDLLGPIYGWFTEGLDSPDLKDAKALLEELS